MILLNLSLLRVGFFQCHISLLSFNDAVENPQHFLQKTDCRISARCSRKLRIECDKVLIHSKGKSQKVHHELKIYNLILKSLNDLGITEAIVVLCHVNQWAILFQQKVVVAKQKLLKGLECFSTLCLHQLRRQFKFFILSMIFFQM